MRGTTSRGRGPKNVRGCEKVVPALAYLFCLALPGSCLAAERGSQGLATEEKLPVLH